ncbi:sugar transferase [Roseivivax lentus]|uniref:Sugar transferase n=2 Tax=Roseivivax lentus TaxID=633194 RepID=A0A1N7Q1Z8_9RHOB|nr:sugar transferase [Roseivivax lentus]
MIPDADARLEEHLKANPDAAREWRTKQKLQNDHRLTRVGSFIRRTSIDELPQVWNVLNGTMSLVGPRPMMECQAELYPGKRYYRQRPGITGLWQISDRHTSDFAERAKFDDAYDREVSLMTDLRILVATIGVVFRCTGV